MEPNPATLEWHKLSVTFHDREREINQGLRHSLLSPAWQMFLFGDGSPTRHLQLLTGERTVVDVVEMADVGDDIAGAPAEVDLVDGPRLRRQVWLKTESGQRMGYATSWWNSGEVKDHLRNSSLPIWASLSGKRTEIFREVLAVYRGSSPHIAEGFGCGDRELWGRHYLFWHKGKPLCLIYEVFSPALEQYLGPQRLIPGMTRCIDLAVGADDPGIRFCGGAALSFVGADGQPQEPVQRWIACWNMFLLVYSNPAEPDLAICLVDASLAKKGASTLALASRGGTRTTILLESPMAAEQWCSAIRQAMPRRDLAGTWRTQYIGSQTRDVVFSAATEDNGIPGVFTVQEAGRDSFADADSESVPSLSPSGTSSARVLMEGSLHGARVDSEYFGRPRSGTAAVRGTQTRPRNLRGSVASEGAGPDGDAEEREDPLTMRDRAAADGVLASAFVHAEREVVATVLASLSRSDASYLVRPLLAIFATHGRSSRLLELAADMEVSACADPSLLLRSESVYSRLLLEACRGAVQPLLAAVLGPAVSAFCEGEPHLEVDPARLQGHEKTRQIRRNQRALCEFADKVLSALEDCAPHFPLAVRHTCASLERQCAAHSAERAQHGVAAAFPPGAATAALLGFRVLTPMLVTPQESGLTRAPPTPATRRALTLASKVLHAASAGQRFTEKEPFLVEANAFVDSAAPRWRRVWKAAAAPLTDEHAVGAVERELADTFSAGEGSIASHAKALRRALVRHAEEIHKVLPSDSASGHHFDSALHDLVALTKSKPSPGDEPLGAGGEAGAAGPAASADEGRGGIPWRAFQRLLVARSRNLLGRPGRARGERSTSGSAASGGAGPASGRIGIPSPRSSLLHRSQTPGHKG